MPFNLLAFDTLKSFAPPDAKLFKRGEPMGPMLGPMGPMRPVPLHVFEDEKLHKLRGCRGECADQLPLSFASTAAPSLVDMHSAQSNSQKQSAQVALICAIYSSSMFWAMSAAYASL